MKLLLILVLALPCAAQFRSVTIWFDGTGCAACTQSMGERVQRLRGVESATVSPEEGKLTVELAKRNRVRVEQIRDMIEQDGTKARRAVVRVMGDVTEADGRWVLRPEGVPNRYEVTGSELAAGRHTIKGEISELHPTSGAMRIEVSRAR